MRLDLLLALRWMRKDPFFTTAIVFILALGIGANTAVFSVVDAVLLRPSPYPSAERVVRIEESSASPALSGVPIKDYQRWAGRSDIFERIAPYIRDTVTLTGDGEPDQVIAVRSLGYFRCSVFPRRGCSRPLRHWPWLVQPPSATPMSSTGRCRASTARNDRHDGRLAN